MLNIFASSIIGALGFVIFAVVAFDEMDVPPELVAVTVNV